MAGPIANAAVLGGSPKKCPPLTCANAANWLYGVACLPKLKLGAGLGSIMRIEDPFSSNTWRSFAGTNPGHGCWTFCANNNGTYVTFSNATTAFIDVWEAYRQGLWTGSVQFRVSVVYVTNTSICLRQEPDVTIGPDGYFPISTVNALSTQKFASIGCPTTAADVTHIVTVYEDGTYTVVDAKQIEKVKLTLQKGGNPYRLMMVAFHDATNAMIGNEYFFNGYIPGPDLAICNDATYGLGTSYSSTDSVAIIDLEAFRSNGHFTSSILFDIYASSDVSATYGTHTMDIEFTWRSGQVTTTSKNFDCNDFAKVYYANTSNTLEDPCQRTSTVQDYHRAAVGTLTVYSDGTIA